jgi:hypothetical protein
LKLFFLWRHHCRNIQEQLVTACTKTTRCRAGLGFLGFRVRVWFRRVMV